MRRGTLRWLFRLSLLLKTKCLEVDIEEDQWNYYGLSDSHGKETLLACVAQALAFHHLCCVNEDLD